MKVFVYDKKTSECIATIMNVEFVAEPETEAKINIVDYDNKMYSYNTNEVKTRIYQN